MWRAAFALWPLFVFRFNLFFEKKTVSREREICAPFGNWFTEGENEKRVVYDGGTRLEIKGPLKPYTPAFDLPPPAPRTLPSPN